MQGAVNVLGFHWFQVARTWMMASWQILRANTHITSLFQSAGPREACQVGLPTTRAIPNLLRLLE
jgi:hypothetical protein